MGKLLDKALSVYSQSDLDRQLKARFFLVLCLAILSVIFVLTIVSALIQFLTIGKIFSSIIIPLLACFCLVCSVLYLLIRGRFYLSSHLLIIIIMATDWIVLIADPGGPLSRLDSFVYTISILGVLPLVVNQRRSIIFLYGFINICFLYVFIYFAHPHLGIQPYDIFDYLCDNTVAIIAACFIASSVYAINDTAIKRAKSEIIEHRHTEEARLKLEAQLHQAQKMEAIGQLAGGVAHDFNNMLSVVIGNTELIMMQQPLESEAQEQLEAIRYTVTRSAALIRQLLAFARKQAVIPEVLDINQTISDMMPMLDQLIGENINLEWNPGEITGHIMIDPSQIDQILTNLVVNARDAIAGIGNISVETRSVSLENSFGIGQEEPTSGPFALLSVSDNGTGMDEETRTQMFEPFFSTKRGYGTGLGLATIYGIVKQNSGLIKFYSEPGLGTTFEIYFPFVESLAVPKAPKTSIGTIMPEGSETVLMVEDDLAILKFGTTVLEQLGYTVLAADTPEKALELINSGEDGIDLLLTDVIMPQMNGQELSQRVRALIPGIKCLFISGYTANALGNGEVLDDEINFLAKPFSIRELAEKVREALS